MPDEPTYPIVSPGRSLFMHIPKTAGQSMRLYLATSTPPRISFRRVPGGCTGLPVSDGDVTGSTRVISAPTSVPGYRTEHARWWSRCPQDRLISGLRHLRRDPNFHSDHARAKGRSLPDLIGDDYIMRRQQDVQTAWLAATARIDAVEEHLRAQPEGDPADLEPDMDDTSLSAPSAPAEALISSALRKTWGCVVRLPITEITAYPLPSPVTRQPNPARRPPDGDRLNPDDLARIAACNQRDEALYEYAKALVEARRVGRMLRGFRPKGHPHAPEPFFTVDLAGPIPGTGRDQCEIDGGICRRWTGPGREFTLSLAPRNDRSYQVTTTSSCHSRPVSEIFEVRVNGAQLALMPEELSDAVGGFCVRFCARQPLAGLWRCVSLGLRHRSHVQSQEHRRWRHAPARCCRGPHCVRRGGDDGHLAVTRAPAQRFRCMPVFWRRSEP